MSEIYKNSSQYEYFDISSGTADTTPTVLLKRAGAVDVALLATRVTTGLPSGVTDRWQVYIPFAQTTTEGDFALEWTVSIGGESVVKLTYYTVVTPYIYPQEIARREGWVIDVDQTSTDLIIAERISRGVINSLVGGSFGSATKTVTAYGKSADVLALPEPIISITSMKENGVTVVDTLYNSFGYPLEITESGRAIRVVDSGVTLAISENVMDPLWTGGKFVNDARYEITGVFGYTYVPEKIQDAAWLLSKDYLCQDATWRNKYIKTVTTGNWDFDFSSLAWWATGNALVDRLLDEYRGLPMMVI